MFTKLVFNIDGELVEIHAHEVVKIVDDLVKRTPLDEAFHPSPSITNLMIDRLIVTDNVINVVNGQYDHFLSVPNHIRKLSHVLHWFYAAKICKSANEEKQISGKWFNISDRLIHVDFSEKDLYVSDHGLIECIMHDFKQIVMDLPWLSNPELLEPFLLLQKIFEGYSFNFSLPPEAIESRTIYIYEQGPNQNLVYRVENLLHENIIEPLDEEFLGKKLLFVLKDKVRSKVPLTDAERNSLITKISSKGHILSPEQLKEEREKRKEQFSQAVCDESYECAKELDPSLTEERFKEIQRKHKEDKEHAELEYSSSELAISFILNVVCKKFAQLVYGPAPDIFLKRIFREMYFDVEGEEFQWCDGFIKRYVAKEIIKETNMGKREFLFRPILSFGKKESGSAYHEFAEAIRAYFITIPALSPQFLAGAMRVILAGQAIPYEQLNFLPNLTAAWFISEVARNESSIISGMMLLDLIEQGKYGWIDALIHPENDKKIKVLDIYGNLKTPQQIGGLHPMAHTDSAKHGDELVSGKKLNIARQKEGSLILEWLFELISKNQPELLREIKSTGPSAIIPSYNLPDLKKIEEKEKDCRDKIRRQEELPASKINPDVIENQNKKITELSLEKKKWKVIEGLIKPLLEFRFQTLANILSLDSARFSSIIEKYKALKINLEEYDFYQQTNTAQGNSFYHCILSELPSNRTFIKSESINEDIVRLRSLIAETLITQEKDYFEEVLQSFDFLMGEDLTKLQVGKELKSFLCSCREAQITKANKLQAELQKEFFDIYCNSIKENHTFAGFIEQQIISKLFDLRIVNYLENSLETGAQSFSKKGGKTETITCEKTYNLEGKKVIHLLIDDNNICSILKPTPLGQEKYRSLFPPIAPRRFSIFHPLAENLPQVDTSIQVEARSVEP